MTERAVNCERPLRVDMSDTTATNRPVELGDEAALDAFRTETDRALVAFYTDGCGICSSMVPVLGG